MNRKIFERLSAIAEKEGEAHRLYDHATSNLAYGRLSSEMRDELVRSTYRATELHAECLELMREMVKELNEILGTGYHLD
jgi:hypothetical protein